MSCGPALCQAGGKRRITRRITRRKIGGCGCNRGGYRATARDKKYLKKWKNGKSIGFTMTSSLKAKGLIPRANGTRRVSSHYKA